MTTPLSPALPLSAPIPARDKKKRVLLVDTSQATRELRAEVMRKLGMDVDCAADIAEARSWWRAAFYDLVLINMERGHGHRDKFCDDIRSATPPQRLAFLVGKPDYLADSPNADEESPVQNAEDKIVGDLKVAFEAQSWRFDSALGHPGSFATNFRRPLLIHRSYQSDARPARSAPRFRRTSIEINRDTDQPRRLTQRGIAMKNLYVGNLPHSTTEPELRNVFEAHGAVEKITLVTDRDTGRSRGFAFVEMTNASETDKAIAALNGSELDGRTSMINEAKPKSDRPRSSGQRFGGRGGHGSDDYRGHARHPREPRW